MFTVAICDDDKIVLSSIQKCIEEFATENNISISVDLYDSGKKLLETSLKYNVIFLDIILQTENGIDIGTQLRKLNAFTYIILIKLDIENPIIRINTAFKGCSSLEKISVLPRIYHN